MAFIVLYASQVQQHYQSDCAAFMIALFYCTCGKSEKQILENGSDRYFFRVVDTIQCFKRNFDKQSIK